MPASWYGTPAWSAWREDERSGARRSLAPLCQGAPTPFASAVTFASPTSPGLSIVAAV